MKTRVFALVLGVGILIANQAGAHHSFAMYDRSRTVTLSGTVKDYIWTAPHVTIQVLSENGRNGPVTWSVEGSSPSVLARGGWTPMLLRSGDKISLGIHPRKDRAAGGLLADEQQVLVNGQPPKGLLGLHPPADETATSNCAAAN